MGVIYILTNPSFPEYIKIGYADNLTERLKQLNRSETIPYSFRAYATYEVQNRLTDKEVHNLIDKINPELRSVETFNGKERVKEFFAMSCGRCLLNTRINRKNLWNRKTLEQSFPNRNTGIRGSTGKRNRY